jgi:hypothetical protein
MTSSDDDDDDDKLEPANAEASSPPVQVAQQLSATISDQGAQQLVELLMQRGYFHAQQAPNKNWNDKDNDNNGSYNQYQQVDDGSSMSSLDDFRLARDHPPAHYTHDDTDCQLIPTGTTLVDTAAAAAAAESIYYYYTRQGLANAITKELLAQGGRSSLNDLASFLQVDVRLATKSLALFPSTIGLQQVGDVLLCKSYWEDIQRQVQLEVQAKGSLAVLDLVSRLQLPVEMVLKHCIATTGTHTNTTSDDDDDNNNNSLSMMTTPKGSKCIVSGAFLENVKAQVVKTVQALEEPIIVSGVCNDHGWPLDLVLEWMATDPTISLSGDLKNDDPATAQYHPHSHSQRQRTALKEFFNANGYLTADIANRLQGVLPSQMVQFIQESFPSAMILGNECAIANVHVENLQVALQESSAASSVLDLQEYLAAEILSRPDMVRLLLSEYNDNSDFGIVVLAEGQGMVVSRGMVKEISETVLPPLIQAFAKTRAEELYQARDATTTISAAMTTTMMMKEEEETTNRKRSKRKAKKETRKTEESFQQQQHQAAGVVPLVQVAGAVLKEFSDLMPDGIEQKDLLDRAKEISWQDDEESGILLVDFCTAALYTDDFQARCEKAVSAETLRIQSSRESKSTLSRKDTASKVRIVDGAFEESFVTACYMVQAGHKFLGLASNSEHFDYSALGTLKQELLQGCCSDLTSRITQYCLFKNEEEGGIFSFCVELDENEEEKEEETNNSGLPAYCNPVDTAARQYPRAYLSCPPPREPLPVLRESLSGSNGVSLARQWVLCGGDCFKGGVRKAEEDGSIFKRPGDVDGFLAHVEENCLLLCGLPFKKLDKRSEKQFVFARRQRLTQLLQNATEPFVVLELTIMLLFQHVKQVVVSGSLLRGPILKMLLDERKISQPIATALQSLADCIEGNDPVDESLVTTVKDCGLCKDISKHTIGVEE